MASRPFSGGTGVDCKVMPSICTCAISGLVASRSLSGGTGVDCKGMPSILPLVHVLSVLLPCIEFFHLSFPRMTTCMSWQCWVHDVTRECDFPSRDKHVQCEACAGVWVAQKALIAYGNVLCNVYMFSLIMLVLG